MTMTENKVVIPAKPPMIFPAFFAEQLHILLFLCSLLNKKYGNKTSEHENEKNLGQQATRNN